jgi:hypothetical protein
MDFQREPLIQSFQAELMAGRAYASITEARKQAETVWGDRIVPGSPFTKAVDEAMEAAVVRTAADLIQHCDTTHQAYSRLVQLLEQQPRLGVRTSTSIAQQAYSTPIPIAFLSMTLADIQPQSWVYEPTAGNGALLITANPQRTIANELNPDRYQELQQRDFHQLTQANALHYRPEQLVDRVITNPPFGSLPDNLGSRQKFQTFEILTTQIDQVIAFNALAALKPDGKAVLILGSKLGQDEEARSDRYHTRESRGFYKQLYDRYNVIDHFTISGALYRKQGAGFPIDIVVIDGQGQSNRLLPAADVPIVYTSFDQLQQEKLPNVALSHLSPPLDSAREHRPERESILRQSTRDDRGIDQTPIFIPDAVTGTGINRGLATNIGQSSASSQSLEPDNQTLQPRPGGTEHETRPQRLDDGLESDVDSVQRSLLESSRDSSRSISRTTAEARDGELSSHLSDSPGNSPRSMARSLEDNPMTEEQAILDMEAKQAAYKPRSQAPAIGTLIPTNMAAPAQAALDRFEQQHGNIDDYLVNRLGYRDRQTLYHHFSAEQVDGAALAIASIEAGKAFINGYQTGIGKGRICAAIMRYAKQEGKAAIFVTQNPSLYADMIRDTRDIGMTGFSPFMTDNNKRIDLPDGRTLRSQDGTAQAAEMERIQRGIVRYDAIFTTYCQLQSVKGEEPVRRGFLRQLAPRSILILDEAHEAGGSSQGLFEKRGTANRAEFVRELVDLVGAAYFSSATAIKRADVIDLYARKTDLRTVVSGDMNSLTDLLDRGGVPLQQMVAAGLTANGDMMRLERSFAGISFEPKVVAVDPNMAENLASAMRGIREFDEIKNRAVDEMDQELKEAGDKVKADHAVGDRGMSSTNFTSIMHNVIGQSLLGMKAEAAVQVCIQSLEAGKKPVIALDNTMSSFIEWYTQENQILPGEAVNMHFGDVLQRYLDRSREVIVEDWAGEQSRRPLERRDLGEAGWNAYTQAMGIINHSDFSAIPVSPIDYIKHRLTESGYRVGEVTGRKDTLSYQSSGELIYEKRSARELSPNAKTATVKQFNSGELDVIILNRAGATGISLHASETFADQRPRHMIMLQPSGDVNQVMQMFGRINRTGQVALPEYSLLMSDLPAEKRPGAILAKKMASLNANTTAARESDMSLKRVVDFFNPYGERVVANILSEEPEVDEMLGNPFEKWAEKEIPRPTELVEKVTGRIPLLPLAEQERLYHRIETAYEEILDTQKAMGANDLEAGRIDLDARTISVMELSPASQPGPFTDAVRVELLDVKSGQKPLTKLQLVNLLQAELTIESSSETVQASDITHIQREGREQRNQLSAEFKVATERYEAQLLTGRPPEAIEKLREKLTEQVDYIDTRLQAFPIGSAVELAETGGLPQLGVVMAIQQTNQTKNPAAASNWRLKIAVPDGSRLLTLPFSQINPEKGRGVSVTSVSQINALVYDAFDRHQTEARMQIQMVTGNLIAGYSQIPQGRFINYTTESGEVKQGLMLPRDASILEILDQRTTKMPDVEQTQQFLGEWTDYRGSVKTGDEELQIRQNKAGELTLTTPTAKQKGGKYYLDAHLLETAQSEFISIGSTMRMTVPAEQAAAVLHLLLNDRGYSLFADTGKDIAKDRLGITLPEFIAVEDLPPPAPIEIPVVAPVATTPIAEATVNNPEQTIAIATSDVRWNSHEIFVQTNLFGSLGIGLEQQTETIKQFLANDSPTFVEATFAPEPTPVATTQTDENFSLGHDERGVTFVPTRENDPIIAEPRFQEIVSDFRGYFDQSHLVDPIATERFLFQELPSILEQNQDWQTLKWSEQSDEQIKLELHQILQQTTYQGSAEVQALMSDHPKFADWLTEQVFAVDRWELVYVSEPDLLERDLSDTQIVLSAAAKAYAFGADNGKIMIDAQGVGVYPGQSFDISYAPTTDTFTVQAKDGSLMAQSSHGEIDVDRVVDIPTEIVQRFSQLVQVMDERGIQLSTQTPQESYEKAVTMAQGSKISQDELANWQKQAVEIGRSPDYLQRLETTIAAAKETGTLSTPAHEARFADQQQWQTQLNQVIQQTRSIIQAQGISTENGLGVVGKIYRIHQSHDGTITIKARDRGEILHVDADGQATSSVTKADADRFSQQIQFIKSQTRSPKTAEIQR